MDSAEAGTIRPTKILVVPAWEKHLGVTPRWFVAYMTFQPDPHGGPLSLAFQVSKRVQADILGDDEYARRMAAFRAIYPGVPVEVSVRPAGSAEAAFG